MSTIATRIAAASVASSVALLGLGAASGQAASLFDGKSLKAGSVTAGKVRKDTLTGVQIRESTLGLVPIANLANLAKLAENAKTAQEAVHAANADHAKAADTAKTADTAKSAETAKEADHAKTADTATTATTLNGHGQSEFMSNQSHAVADETVPIASATDGTPASVAVSCPVNEKAIGGGGGWFIPSSNAATALDAPMTNSSPVLNAEGEVTGWKVYGRNASGQNRVLRAYAICVPKSV